MRKRGFTLIGLVACLCVVGVLSSVLIGWIDGAVEMAKDVRCKSNLWQLAIAAVSYASDYQDRFSNLDIKGSDDGKD